MKTREEILQMVENEDVEFIRLQFTDMFGTLKNVAVTATQLQYMKDNRYLIDGSCMYGRIENRGRGYVSVPGFGHLCNPAMETAAGKSCKTFV